MIFDLKSLRNFRQLWVLTPQKEIRQGAEAPCCLISWGLKLSFFVILREVAESIAFLDPATSLRFVQDDGSVDFELPPKGNKGF